MDQGIGTEVAKAMSVDMTTGPLKTMKRKLKPKKSESTDTDPYEDLRVLVSEHKSATRTKLGILAQASHRKNRETGDPILCRLPYDLRVSMIGQKVVDPKAKAGGLVLVFDKKIDELRRSMTRALRRVPIWNEFLSDVYGCGPVIGAYIASEIQMKDRGTALKISNIRRYCGTAIINGHLERKTKGQVSRYNAGMRVRLYQMITCMTKNAAKGKPFGTTSKYLDVMRNDIVRSENSERFDGDKTWTGSDGATRSAKGAIRSRAMWKAIDVFLEDLYIVWRTIEGLPVWPSYYAAKLGYAHGGQIAVNAPKMLTLEEAKATVGFVGGVLNTQQMHPLKLVVNGVEVDEPDEDLELDSEL